MRRSTIGVVVPSALLSTAVTAMGQSSDASLGNLLGTWKQNLAKSKSNPGPPPASNSSTWESSSEGGFKNTTDGIDAQGRVTHTELMGKFDGKDYPLTGAPAANTTRAFKRIDDRTYEYVEKVDGKVMTTVRMVAPPDGKTPTNTSTGKNAQGQTGNNVTVWEKQ
jgi:hypothetical protein